MTLARDDIHPSTSINDSPVEAVSFESGIAESNTGLEVYKATWAELQQEKP